MRLQIKNIKNAKKRTFFNHCIDLGKFPKEWKSAIGTPLYKIKGFKSDLNNFGAISVLPPIANIFEKNSCYANHNLP